MEHAGIVLVPVEPAVVKPKLSAVHRNPASSESICEAEIANVQHTYTPVEGIQEIEMNNDDPSSDGKFPRLPYNVNSTLIGI